MGGRVVEKLDKGSAAAGVNHVLAMDAKALLRVLDAAWLHRFRGVTAPSYCVQTLPSYAQAVARVLSCVFCDLGAVLELWRLHIIDRFLCPAKLSFSGLEI
jgi:hypothetical protein